MENTNPPERFWVNFSKTSETAYTTWDLDFATLEEAREMAESFVDDREADEATVTARMSHVYQVYKRGDWCEVVR